MRDDSYCQAKNRLGELCGRKAMRGSKYCKVHRKKQSWFYKLWDEQKVLVFAMGIIGIILSIYGIMSGVRKEDVQEVVKQNTTTSKSLIEDVKNFTNEKTNVLEKKMDTIIEHTKTIPNRLGSIESLLKKQKDETQYESEKDSALRLSDEYVRGLVGNETKRILDSALQANKLAVKKISNKKLLWEEIFPDGYGLFYVGYDKKTSIYWNIDTSEILVSKDFVNLKKITREEMVFTLPDISVKSNGLRMTNFEVGIPRQYKFLNDITYKSPILGDIGGHTSGINVGIISDNTHGIVGIIGFGAVDMQQKNKQILDYSKLQFAYK